MKCYECGKLGLHGRNCEQQTKKTSLSCGFCAGPKRCTIKDCKARDSKCSKCKLYGHFDACCNGWARSKARKSKDDNKPEANAVNMDGEEGEEEANHVRLYYVPSSTLQQVKQVFWSKSKNRFTQQVSPAMTPLKLEIENLHNVDLSPFNNIAPKEPLSAANKKTMVDTTNCPDTGATVFLAVWHKMEEMGLRVSNLYRDQTCCLTANESPLKILRFIPVKVSARDSEGMEHETNECLYFVEDIRVTLIPLRVLKDLGCIPEHWPLPATYAQYGSKEGGEEKVTTKTRANPAMFHHGQV